MAAPVILVQHVSLKSASVMTSVQVVEEDLPVKVDLEVSQALVLIGVRDRHAETVIQDQHVQVKVDLEVNQNHVLKEAKLEVKGHQEETVNPGQHVLLKVVLLRLDQHVLLKSDSVMIDVLVVVEDLPLKVDLEVSQNHTLKEVKLEVKGHQEETVNPGQHVLLKSDSVMIDVLVVVVDLQVRVDLEVSQAPVLIGVADRQEKRVNQGHHVS
jgi:hypothetical protein